MPAKHFVRFAVVAFACAGVAGWYLAWQSTRPARESRDALTRLQASVAAGDAAAILNSLQVPPALSSRTIAEQADFLRKALGDEISAAGIRALARDGRFGCLLDVFPDEGPKWAQQAGLNPADCVAFRMEHNGIRAEAVLLVTNGVYRVIRCNNIAQMASHES